MTNFTHLDDKALPRMVDIGEKAVTQRSATASCLVELGEELIASMENGDLINKKKGSIIHTAIIAGIMGTKKTSDLIPMCHPIGLEKATIEITEHSGTALKVSCTCKLSAKTGIEMEALTGASTAALTLYDMCKSQNPSIVITDLKLEEKRGGKSDYNAS